MARLPTTTSAHLPAVLSSLLNCVVWLCTSWFEVIIPGKSSGNIIHRHFEEDMIDPLQRSTKQIPFFGSQHTDSSASGLSDAIDTFRDYNFRETCNISSLNLHQPSSPLCPDRESLLTAMSSGGRIGMDAPYMPRGCDMRWFSTQEICEILGRFEKVVLVGDSMIMHLLGAVNILVRENLGYGAVTDWNFSNEER
jgi:hypothetical protein